jgi:exonuclease SbcC
MLERIELHNFQCHKDLEIKFGKITTLVGPSDSGKTTVLRALKWLFFNSEKTKQICRRGETEVSVSVVVDGRKITRTNKNNSYTIDNADFNAIGRAIPPEVQNILKVQPQNNQDQHDPYFWFRDSGSALVANLNKVVDLTKLDEWIKKGTSIEKEYRNALEYHTKTKAELETKAYALKHYRKLDEELKEIEEVAEEIKSKKQAYKDLEDLLICILDTENKLKKQEEYVDDLKKLVSEYEKIYTKKQKADDLEQIIIKRDNLVYRIGQIDDLLSIPLHIEELMEKQKRLNSLEAIVIEILKAERYCKEFSSVSELSASCNELVKRINKYNEMSALLQKLNTATNETERLNREVEEIKDEIQERTGGICPLCGGVLSESYECDSV